MESTIYWHPNEELNFNSPTSRLVPATTTTATTTTSPCQNSKINIKVNAIVEIVRTWKHSRGIEEILFEFPKLTCFYS